MGYLINFPLAALSNRRHSATSEQNYRGTHASEFIIGSSFLLPIFFGIVLYFSKLDFYHQSFFAHGLSVLIYNVVRIVFLFLFAWLVYAPGSAIAALITPDRIYATIPPIERAIVGFGLGVAVWEILMLLLGEAGFYYRSIAAGVSAVVLIASARHFGAIVKVSYRNSIHLRRHVRISVVLSIAAVLVASIVLLLVRGLYPGGGHDYYTHYFYYYIQVLKNHGLAPNDVWYHYYYSRGYGLCFLGMLLTDPEAAELVTFCCVTFAAIAVIALIDRVAPDSFWPAGGALLYLLYNLIPISRSMGGAFQEDHETVSALVVLLIWGLCMAHRGSARPYLYVTALVGVAATIITQPVGIVFTAYFALRSAVAMLKRQWSTFSRYALVTAVIGLTLLGIYGLNYAQTGLATDQPLGLMLRFADISRLDGWGVIPQLIIIMWTRENYKAFLPTTPELLSFFLRAAAFWPLLAAYIVALGTKYIPVALNGKNQSPTDLLTDTTAESRRVPDVLVCLTSVLTVLLVISLSVGQLQNVSFERFSSFYIPLLVLLTAALCGQLMLQPLKIWQSVVLKRVLPLILVIGTIALWQSNYNWISRAENLVSSSVRFFDGRYSLADAYGDQDAQASYGGINPEAAAAWRHAEAGSPIWSTNIGSYCMIPGCWIESVVSFKISPHLVQILTGSPEQAKRLLQEAGINYFLIIKSEQLIDVLVYSRLFAANNISQYLGIKWTDGNAFLLTWIGPNTAPIGPDFLTVYNGLLARPEHRWFLYRELVEQIATATQRLRSKPWGAEPDLLWRSPTPATRPAS
jgi:hypothetical protein